ncbi:MAG: tetratricopeptide repeat protein [Candidatus Heimdallarchaeota archaeon]|nr:tetratricopeptide repeat protein [Candidatus Heimdallarchaeota archaeon]
MLNVQREIEKNLIHGNYIFALQNARAVNNKFQSNIYQSYINMLIGNYQESYKLAHDNFSIITKDPSLGGTAEGLISKILYGFSLTALGNTSEGEKKLKEVENEFQFEIHQTVEKANLRFKVDTIEEANFILASMLFIHGYIHWNKGELADARICYMKSSEIYDELGDEFRKYLSLIGVAEVERQIGNLDVSEELLIEIQAYSVKTQNKFIQALVKINFGLLYFNLGDFSKSEPFVLQALDMSNSIDYPIGKSMAHNTLGNIYLQRGELVKSTNYHRIALELRKNLGDVRWILSSYINLGRALMIQGEFQSAIKLITKGFEQITGKNNHLWEVKPIHYLIKLHTFTKNYEKVKYYLQEFKKLLNTVDNPISNQVYLLSKAISLKSSPRIIDKAEAQKLLYQIIENPQFSINYEIEAIIHLTEILISELRFNQEALVLQEINEMVQRLIGICKRTKSTSLVLDIGILRSKLSLVEGNVDVAQKLLHSTLGKAESYQLDRYITIIENDIAKLGNELTRWKELVKSNSTMLERIEKAGLDDYIREVQRIQAS